MVAATLHLDPASTPVDTLFGPLAASQPALDGWLQTFQFADQPLLVYVAHGAVVALRLPFAVLADRGLGDVWRVGVLRAFPAPDQLRLLAADTGLLVASATCPAAYLRALAARP